MKVLLLFALVAAAAAWPNFGFQSDAGGAADAQKQHDVNFLLHKIYGDIRDSNLKGKADSFDPEANLSHYSDGGNAVQTLMRDLKDNRLLQQRHWFSLFNPRQREEALMLFDVLIHCKDWDTFVSNAAYFRQIMNEGEFVYALYVAVIHSPLSEHVVLPPLYEVTPHLFTNSEVIEAAYRAKQTQKPGKFKSSFTGTKKNPEQRVAYFGEDIGMNTHHVTWHMEFPFWWDDKYSHHLDRKGENFFWVHHQLTVRFDAERLSNYLDPVDELHWEKPIVQGFAPHTTYKYGGQFPSRPDNVDFEDVDGVARIRDLLIVESRIRDAIAHGYIVDRAGNHIDIMNERGIDVLGDVIESSVYSPNVQYYGALHNTAHIVLGRQSDPHGKYDLPLSRMKQSHGYIIGGGITVVLVVIVLMAVLVPPKPEIRACPASYDSHPLILVSLDGFRADYLEKGLTPGLQALVEGGVHAPFMKPSYPTLTFPNHYTIVTGLYPESHGIIANKFYDPEFHATFSLGSEESLQGRWWGGEPIWNTLTRQGKRSATFFWPGSDADIGGQHPTYWMPYNDDTLFSERVQQVLSWITLPAEERPAWVSLYLNEPDHTGHGEGPDSNQVEALIMYADRTIQQLVSGLEDLGLVDCVNLVLVADHGMAASGPDKIIKLKDYVADIFDLAYTYSGAFGRISLKNDSEAIEMDVLEKLTCQREELRAYDYRDLPTRFHFSNNRRIEDIVLDLDAGYTVSVSSDFYLEGQHGYDNYEQKMNALFIGHGPAFKKGVEIEPFQNIELYDLMCHLTGVAPAPNNGTEGSLYHALVIPPTMPSLPQVEKPPVASYPGAEQEEARLTLSGCDGDLAAVEPWMSSLDLSEAQKQEAEARHLPWGVPHSGNLSASLVLLHHASHVTAFSESLRMPLWTSVTLSGAPTDPQPAAWCSDVRLTPEATPTCAQYESLAPFNVSMAPLLPPGFLQDSELVRVPYMVSNAVPAAPQLVERWSQLVTDLVPAWLAVHGSLNLVLGPVFDNDADSHVDDFTTFSPPPEMPSDMFAVVTRCESPGVPVDSCPPEDLDTLAFIVPEALRVINCLNATRFAQEFSAKVRDVETATGLTLFPLLAPAERTRLELRIHSDVWPLA